MQPTEQHCLAGVQHTLEAVMQAPLLDRVVRAEAKPSKGGSGTWLDRTKKLTAEAPAKKKTREFIAKPMVSQKASNTRPGTALTDMCQRAVAEPYRPKQTTAMTPLKPPARGTGLSQSRLGTGCGATCHCVPEAAANIESEVGASCSIADSLPSGCSQGELAT